MPTPRASIKRIPDLAPLSGRPPFERLAKSRKALRDHASSAVERRAGLLDRFEQARFLPAFLLRTFNDVLHRSPRDLTGLQKSVLAAWTSAGLGRRQCADQLERFLTLGTEALEKVRADYFDLSARELDNAFLRDLQAAKWEAFFRKASLSPFRLESALSTGSFDDLTSAESALTSAALRHFRGAQLERCEQARASGALAGLVQRSKVKTWQALIEEARASGAPPPVTFYKLRATLHEYKIVHSSDHIGGKADPRFVVNAFWIPLNQPGYQSWKVTFNSLGDDVGTCDWKNYAERCAALRELFEELQYIPFAGSLFDYKDFCDLQVINPSYLWPVGARPLIIVNAFEDDTFIEEDERKYIDFGMFFASRIATFDPTGIMQQVVGIYSLAWQILCWLDDLDKDDRFEPVPWLMDESAITAEGETVSYPEFALHEIDGDNEWRLKIKVVASEPSTIVF